MECARPSLNCSLFTECTFVDSSRTTVISHHRKMLAVSGSKYDGTPLKKKKKKINNHERAHGISCHANDKCVRNLNFMPSHPHNSRIISSWNARTEFSGRSKIQIWKMRIFFFFWENDPAHTYTLTHHFTFVECDAII